MLGPTFKKVLRYTGVVIAIFAFLFLISLFIPLYGEICAPNEYTHAKECGQYNLGPFTLLWIAYVIDGHNGLVTATATVFLTIVTGLLAYLAQLQYITSRTQLSAFVFIDEMRALFDLDTRATQPEDVAKPHIVSGWAFRPIWRNSGETQTRNMVAHVDCELRDRPLPPRYTFPENHTNNTRLLLGPKSGAIGGSPRTFTLEEMRRVQTGHAFLYLWGWARYENVFQRQTHGHVTRYCVQVVIITDPGLSNCVFNYLVHTEGNCSDSECAMMGLP